MLRRITLTLLMLVSISVILPIASSTAHGIRQSVESRRNHRHYRRHSRAWWRRYRARLRRRRAAAAAAALAAHRNAPLTQVVPNTFVGSTTVPTTTDNLQPANAPEMRYGTNTAAPGLPGQSSLTVVALSRPTPTYLSAREQRRYFSGIPTADLRRIVIEKMIAAGGWVINDFEREITGHRVFVVTAQTPADGRTPEKSWNFYFTEVNGRIYSLTTNTPPHFSDRMSIEAERFLASLYAQQSASTNR